MIITNHVEDHVKLVQQGTFSGSWVQENYRKQGFKNGKTRSENVVTVLPKVTKTGSIVGHRKDYYGVRVLPEWPAAQTQQKLTQTHPSPIINRETE